MFLVKKKKVLGAKNSPRVEKLLSIFHLAGWNIDDVAKIKMKKYEKDENCKSINNALTKFYKVLCPNGYVSLHSFRKFPYIYHNQQTFSVDACGGMQHYTRYDLYFLYIFHELFKIDEKGNFWFIDVEYFLSTFEHQNPVYQDSYLYEMAVDSVFRMIYNYPDEQLLPDSCYSKK